MPETVKTAKTRRDWRPAFLEAFAAHGTVTAACKAARVSRSTVYEARQRSETFALAWSDVECEVTDRLEQTALRLALAGDRHLIEFLLKARKPETYREQRFRIEHSAGSCANCETLRAMSDSELEELAADLDARMKRAG